MRPRERDDDDDDDDDDSPLSTPPPKVTRAPLSSLVVVADPDAVDKSGDTDGGSHRRSSPSTRRHSMSPLVRLRSFSPPPRRRGSPSSSPRRRRRSPSGGYQPRYEGLRDNRGYGMRETSLSPPRRRRLENASFDERNSPHYAHGYHGGRGAGRFQDMSPPYGRSNRAYGRGSGSTGKYLTYDGRYVHRNDPNLSPREGDWICQNPSCGNLNFARRTHCNNCNKHRFAPDFHGPSRSPRGAYLYSPARLSPGRPVGPPPDRTFRREVPRYRSPPHGWLVDDPRDFPSRPPTGWPGRFADSVRRERADYPSALENRDRRKLDWDVPRGGFFVERRGKRSPSPPTHFVREIRDRRLSPSAGRSLKGSFDARAGDERNYPDPYAGRGHPRDGSAAHGRVYRHENDSFAAQGRGRGDRHAIPRGRNGAVY